MKLLQRELRSLIKEVAGKQMLTRPRSFVEAGNRGLRVDGLVHDISAAMTHVLAKDIESEETFNNVSMVVDDIADDSFLSPARYEDVDSFAEDIALNVVKRLTPHINTLAHEILEAMMELR